jgi:hypothetical protein
MNTPHSLNIDDVNEMLKNQNPDAEDLQYAVAALQEFSRSSDASTFGIEQLDLLPDIARYIQANWNQVQAILTSENQDSVVTITNTYGDQSTPVSLEKSE